MWFEASPGPQSVMTLQARCLKLARRCSWCSFSRVWGTHFVPWATVSLAVVNVSTPFTRGSKLKSEGFNQHACRTLGPSGCSGPQEYDRHVLWSSPQVLLMTILASHAKCARIYNTPSQGKIFLGEERECEHFSSSRERFVKLRPQHLWSSFGVSGVLAQALSQPASQPARQATHQTATQPGSRLAKKGN